MGLDLVSFEQGIVQIAPKIAASLPAGLSAERFRAVAIRAVQQNPDLLQCNPQSLFNACLKAAEDGLLPDGREGAIVPRKGTASWQPMVFGIQTKAKRKGGVSTLVAHLVYEGEEFEHELGDDERIVHKRDWGKVINGNEVAVYAIAKLKDGSIEREVMTAEMVVEIQKTNAANSSIWRSSKGEMWKKTVLHRLAKRLPSLEEGDDELNRTMRRIEDLYPELPNRSVPQLAAPLRHEAVPSRLDASPQKPVQPPQRQVARIVELPPKAAQAPAAAAPQATSEPPRDLKAEINAEVPLQDKHQAAIERLTRRLGKATAGAQVDEANKWWGDVVEAAEKAGAPFSETQQSEALDLISQRHADLYVPEKPAADDFPGDLPLSGSAQADAEIDSMMDGEHPSKMEA